MQTNDGNIYNCNNCGQLIHPQFRNRIQEDTCPQCYDSNISKYTAGVGEDDTGTVEATNLIKNDHLSALDRANRERLLIGPIDTIDEVDDTINNEQLTVQD